MPLRFVRTCCSSPSYTGVCTPDVHQTDTSLSAAWSLKTIATMESKDVAATVLASLSFFVSAVTACFTVFAWWCQDKIRKLQRVTDVKQRYTSDGIGYSVLQVAQLWQHWEGKEHAVWDVLYRKEASIETVGNDVLLRRELWQHMSQVDGYWEVIADLHSKGELPGFFKSDGGWLARADNYRRLFEPLFIANYSQMEKTPYLATAADGTPLKRPKRYWYIQQLWEEMQPTRDMYNTTVWAEEFERLRSTHQDLQLPAGSMQGVCPQRLQHLGHRDAGADVEQ